MSKFKMSNVQTFRTANSQKFEHSKCRAMDRFDKSSKFQKAGIADFQQPTFSDFQKSDTSGRYDRGARVETSGKQDEKMKAAGDKTIQGIAKGTIKVAP